MRTRGWDGDLPRDETEARARIVAAATRCVDQLGPAKVNIAAVAAELGITRQTVYRYFPSLPELLLAVAEAGAEQFLDRMQAFVAHISTPVEAATESIVFTLSTIRSEPYLGLLLQTGENVTFSRGATSARATSYGAQMLARMPVDWPAFGIRDDELPDLAEIIMRLTFSFLQYPADPPHSDAELRTLIRRWLGPALRG
ncbi:TetR/AcrR family transcriptional regulator [Nocardia sp. NPDC051832]|uniref:TetR/AcrR family transcriptional regulator n=1 Tax=Nocardia sp. NPDC051832 TaxID=3155673 RepID=UPI00342057F0